jgi:hypothetical protein
MNKIILILMSLLFSFSVTANEIKVDLIKGDVNLIRDDKTQKLEKNFSLKTGDIIQTTKKSFVRISLHKSIITIAPNSYYQVSSKQQESESSIGTLLYGHVHAAFEKDPKLKRIIKTQTAALGIRGTKILLHVARDKKEYWERYKGKVHSLPKLDRLPKDSYSQICCIEGLIEVKTQNGTKKNLSEGQIMTFTSSGKNLSYRKQTREILLKSSKAFGFDF